MIIKMNQELLIYNDMYERTLNFNDLDKARDFVKERVKKTYLLKGIEGIEILKGALNIDFDVIETDDHLIKRGLFPEEKIFLTSRYVWGHLAGFLNISSRLYDFMQVFWTLSEEDRIECQEHFAEILKILFNHRLKEQEKNSRIRDIFITVFSDGFGEFPRVIHSGIYYPYPDHEALDTIVKGFDTINEQNADRQYEFKTAEISPYQSKFNFTNGLSMTEVGHGDTIESGIAIINSECKKASYNYQNFIWRQTCKNGATSRWTDNELNIRHYESGFEAKIRRGLVKALRLEDEYAHKFIEASKHDQKISDDWADLLDIPSSILAMEKKEKEEIIGIGKSQGLKFTPYEVVNALTFKATHQSHDDATKERINEKANIVIDNIEKLSLWEPKQ